MDVYGLRLQRFEHLSGVVTVHRIEQSDIGPQAREIVLDKPATALMQEPEFAEGKADRDSIRPQQSYFPGSVRTKAW